MNKDEFNKLEIIDQINYLNNNLKDNQTLTTLCKSIGIARSTVRGRAEKIGYIFDKDINQYIEDNQDSSGRAYSKLTVSDTLTNKSEPIEIPTVSNELTNNPSVSNGLILSSSDENNLNYLLRNIDILKGFIEGSKGSSAPNEINSIDDIINDIYKFKQEKRNYKVKSLRIDSDILNEFEAIANDISDKGINQQEFLNYILKSYIDFYKSFK
ncbi:MAG: hypothetical protein ACRCXT_13205 [Paraclostridium sp.]